MCEALNTGSELKCRSHIAVTDTDSQWESGVSEIRNANMIKV